MRSHTSVSPGSATDTHWLQTGLVMLALVAGVALFILVDLAYFRFADARFPHVGESTALANLWGVVSRAHWLAVLIPIALWKPGWLALRVGSIRQHARMLLMMLLANCGVIAAYLWLTNSGTPYSGNQWLLTEVVTVPVVEELFWRGLVFTMLLAAFRRIQPETTALRLTVWSSGIAFGLLHANNLFAGVALPFVAIQCLNASIWGVVYGYARAKTDSVYPAMLLHAAMNLVVILF